MFQRLSIFTLLIILASFAFAVQADTNLPNSAWYAVAWVRDSDSLHWINADGEQGSIERPTWTEEAANTEPWIHISANGRILVQIVQQANGYEGIGFYDIQTGQFLNTHQALAGEHFVTTEHYPSIINSSRFAIGLTAPDVSAWRILSFDLNTGNAIAQLTSAQMDTGLPNNQYYPYVVYYDLDEGLGQTVVYFQMHSQLADASYMMYYWYPELVPNNQIPNGFGLSQAYNDGIMNTAPLNPQKGFDLLPLTGFPLVAHGAGTSANQIQGVVAGVQGELAFEVGGSINRVRWLNSGQWLGYHYQNGVQNDHWRVMPASVNAQAIPMGPNFSSLHATPDGFLAMDGMQARLMHITTLNFEGFAAEIGTTVFQPFAYYRVVYVTPIGASFSLGSIPSEAPLNVPLGDNGNVQAPAQSCGTAPSPRLTVGESARVTFTDGASLNVRTAPSGDFLMQIPEGTVVTVVGGPVCNNNYFWWNLQFQSQGVTVGGWAAEGDSSDYFLEPYTPSLINPPQLAPTATLAFGVAAAQPTLAIVTPLGLAPTSTPAFVITTICNNSPASRLQVGMVAQVESGITLSVYSQANSPEVSLTLAESQGVKIIGGAQCRNNGQRMWQIEASWNGQTISGWASEGNGQTYYMRPRPARANN